MKLKWTKEAERDYRDLKKNPVAFKKAQLLLEAIEINYEGGIGHFERLKGFGEKLVYSRRINSKDRLVYEVIKGEGEQLEVIILSIQGHYKDR